MTLGTADQPFRAEQGLVLGSEIADLGDIRRWHIDWTALVNGATIGTATWQVPQGLADSSPSTSGKVTSAILDTSGALSGRTYRVTCTVTTSLGETFRRAFELSVGNCGGLMGVAFVGGGSGGGGYTTIEEEGVALTQRSTLNFIGVMVTVADSGGKTVATFALPSDSVTFAQLQNVATDRLLGRDTAGSGDVEEIALDSTLAFTGSGSIQRAALSGAVSAAAGSNTTAFASGNFGSLDIVTTGFASVGTTPATTGTVRLPNLGTITGRDVAGTGNIQALLITNGDAVVIGDNTHASILNGLTLSLRVANVVYLTAGSSAITASVANLRFDGSVVNPNIFQVDETSNSVNGDKLNIHAQNSTGTTTTGGALDLAPGSGTTAGGLGRLMSGSATQRFGWNDTGIGFYATAPVAKPTVTVTHSGVLTSLLSALSTLGLLTDSATATSPAQQFLSGNVETSSTTTTTILSIDTSGYGSQVSAVAEIYVTCVDVIGQGASKNTCSFSRQGGTLTNLSALTANGGSAGGTVSVDISGANLRVRVTAPDVVNYRWEALAIVTYSNTVA